MSSIAPVGLDLARMGDDDEEATNPRLPILSLRHARRNHNVIAMAALSVCGLALVGGMAARLTRSTASGAGVASPPVLKGPSAASPQLSALPAATADGSAPRASTPAGDLPSTGTLFVHPPALPGRVWVDGRSLSTPAALLNCGEHEVRIGSGAPRKVSVPCGGEVTISQ